MRLLNRKQRVRISAWATAAVIACPLIAHGAQGAGDLSDAEQAQVAQAVHGVMQRNAIPAVSLAIVRQAKIAYLQAFGDAELPSSGSSRAARSAQKETRFAIGSVSKEFTAAAILLLVDRGKLSLADKVAKFLPQLTDANQVTVRELLSHTSGYRDYFLQEYIPAQKQRPTTVADILKTWAEGPLDFEPGSQWQYSSTNYVIAARIVELVSGEPYPTFLREQVLRPAGITDARFTDDPAEPRRDAVGYDRFALGPPRPAPLIGRNWLFGMADLEMTARDVALWDISLMEQRLLSSSSTLELESETKTKEGEPISYSLGFFVNRVVTADGTKTLLLHHPGEISGFRAHNFVLPALKSAVVILTNAEYSEGMSQLARQLQSLVGLPTVAGTPAEPGQGAGPEDFHSPESNVEARADRLLKSLAAGVIPHHEFTPDALAVFSPQAVGDIRQSLGKLGPLRRVRLDSTQSRGGTRHYALTVFYERQTLQIAEYDLPDGRIEQFFIDAK